jgi:response regulator RpfG family c-di-GMP phosphodiesterase
MWAVGMNDYIAKPVDERLLYSKIVGIEKTIFKKKQKRLNKIVPQNECIDLAYLESRASTLMMEMII